MGFRKIAFFLPICFKPEKQAPSSHPSNQYSLKRLSLSGLSKQSSSSALSDLSNSCFASNLHVFTHKELKAITGNFSDHNFLGEGGFGPVYKGSIDNEISGLPEKHVAVKVLDLGGAQGHREWLAEVIFLGQLRHCHLVKLIGYCCEHKHRLLVYEYMSKGNLENQLFKGYSTTLPWLTRMKVAAGAAKGLAFLHEEEKPVIYRDLKASNILLDSEFNAKLSDFGLATDGPEGDETHITTRIMGTAGYAAPEYIKTGHLTMKSDVYSFGVVLLELLTGKRSVDRTRPSREQDLVKWARPFLKDALKLERVIDLRLEGQFSVEGAKKVAALAYQCLSHDPKSRPAMNAVVQSLDQVMELNETQTGCFVYVVSIHERAENAGNNEEERQSKRIRKKITPFYDRMAVHSDLLCTRIQEEASALPNEVQFEKKRTNLLGDPEACVSL